MCQAYEGERAFLIASEKRDLKKKYEDHKSGVKPLTDDEFKTLCIEIIMAYEE